MSDNKKDEPQCPKCGGPVILYQKFIGCRASCPNATLWISGTLGFKYIEDMHKMFPHLVSKSPNDLTATQSPKAKNKKLQGTRQSKSKKFLKGQAMLPKVEDLQ